MNKIILSCIQFASSFGILPVQSFLIDLFWQLLALLQGIKVRRHLRSLAPEGPCEDQARVG